MNQQAYQQITASELGLTKVKYANWAFRDSNLGKRKHGGKIRWSAASVIFIFSFMCDTWPSPKIPTWWQRVTSNRKNKHICLRIKIEVPSTVTPLAQTIQATLQTTSWFEMSHDGIYLNSVMTSNKSWTYFLQ